MPSRPSSAIALIAKYKPRTTYSGNGPRCRAGQLSPKLQELLRDLREQRVTFKEIERILRAEFKAEVSWSSVERHINGECRCATRG